MTHTSPTRLSSALPRRPGFYGYFEDITRRVAAERRYVALEEKLSDVIRSTSDWVWETDSGLRLTEVSARIARSEEHTSELQSLMRISYAVFCLKKKK